MPISMPNVTLNILKSKALATNSEQRVLILGQMTTGTASPLEVQQNIPNNNDEDKLFGADSHLTSMIKAFKRENNQTALDAIPLAAASNGVAAKASIKLSGTAIENSALFFTIISKKTKFQIDILTGQTAEYIAQKISDLFNQQKKLFSATVNSKVITLEANNKGTLGNEYGIAVDGSVDGLTVELTAWSGGANDPGLTGVLDKISNIRYQTVLWPSNYDLAPVKEVLDTRFNSSNSVMAGVAFQVKVDTLANLKSYAAAYNSPSIVIIGQKKNITKTYIGPAAFESSDVIAAQICAIRALRLTPRANLTKYLTTVSPSDQFGGAAISSLPYFNTAIPNVPIADFSMEFSQVDQKELLSSGISLFGSNCSNSLTIFSEFVTTYLYDNAGNKDDSYKFLNTIDTISTIREFYFVNLKARYAQTRLTNGDLIAGRDMANEGSIAAFCNELYDHLSDIALTQNGSAAKKDYNQNLVIAIDVRNGIATIDQAPLLVSQLRAILGTIQINFGG